ncbi:MAG: NAD(P)-binding domain-containing protein [Candidatus Promineifilaceae bacterium]|nr:NAD(P)-binding domain-containing protein [Candidatus Promineifilaceae bacterium]
MTQNPVLIIGAGPFGLSLAARLQHLDIDHLILGKPMHFWQANMPPGMLLRSASDWHLDPQNIDTIEAYLQTLGLQPSDVEPLSLQFYLDYTNWFQEQKQFNILPRYVTRLDENNGKFTVALENGQKLTADQVVLALGFQSFSHIPADLAALLPQGRYGHTCDIVDLPAFSGRRVLIIGGRQSAFEWTALLHEAGAAAVHVCYRHDTPQFTEADWSWFNTQVDHIVQEPGWFRDLSPEEQESVNHRFWVEGRLKLEPWLAPRIDHESITLWPNSEMRACSILPDGALQILLSNGQSIVVDDVIFATGYKVDMSRVDLLARGNILKRLTTHNGYPQLDETFQTNIPGLYITSMPAVQDFGLFFAFTISVRASAQVISRALQLEMA